MSSITQQPKLRKFKNVSEDNEYENGCDSDGGKGPFFEAVMDEDSKDDYYIEFTNNFTAEASTAPLTVETTPTLCIKKLHLWSYLETLWSETGYFGLLGYNHILFIILLYLI